MLQRHLKKLALVMAILLVTAPAWPDQSDTANFTKNMILAHKTLLMEWVQDKELIGYLKDREHCEHSLENIIRTDTNWPLAKSLHKKILKNNIAKRFKKLVSSKDYFIAEMMLVDTLGALHAAYPIPSDYWQGDEAKFYEPIKRRGPYVSSSRWDHSTQAYTFFVSLPVFEKGNIVGVLIAGLDVSAKQMMEMPLEDLLELNIQ